MGRLARFGRRDRRTGGDPCCHLGRPSASAQDDGAGAVLAALGLSIFVLSSSLALNALGMFVAGVGSSAVGSLVFYAIAVKGATRYKGTLIGALGMVFTMRFGERIFREWSLDAPMLVLGIGVALTLVGRSSPFPSAAARVRGFIWTRIDAPGDAGRAERP